MSIFIDSSYYSEHLAFIENVSSFIEDKLAGNLKEWERQGRFPDSVFQLLGQQGYLGLLVPEEDGGIGGDFKLAGAWCEAFGELCSVGLTTAVNMHSLVITRALALHGTKEAKQKFLPSALLGDSIGAYAFSEPSAGSDLSAIRTQAKKTDAGWVINGNKTFITNGARANFVLTLCKTDPQAGYDGFTTFLIDTSLKGFSVEKTLGKVGWHCSDTAELRFDNLEVPDWAVLGQVGQGWQQANNNLNWERLMLTLLSLAGERACFRQALRYSKERQAFGKNIIEFDAVANHLLEMQLKIKHHEALTHYALDLLTDGQDCRAEVCLAKRIVCEEAVDVANKAIQIHGGYGYTDEFLAERWWRDLRLMPIGGGTTEILGTVVSKAMRARVNAISDNEKQK